MARNKFRYNPETLTFEKYKAPRWWRIFQITGYVAMVIIMTAVVIQVYSYFFPSPRERAQKREIELLSSELKAYKKKFEEMNAVANNLKYKGSDLYRLVLNMEPEPESLWEGGIGGSDRYARFEGHSQSKLLTETQKSMERTKTKLVNLSKSFIEIAEYATNKEERLAHTPAIQPINNKDLRRLSSGFGYRYHPILKIRKFHHGVDFSASTGTEIYATGDGVVEKAKYATGYGYHVVINHEYGYQTLYGHMSKLNVRRGQKIKRGELIGFVGNTGLSSAPHLHYEVIKDGVKVNPIHYFHRDLGAEEYETVLNLSKQSNQSFD